MIPPLTGFGEPLPPIVPPPMLPFPEILESDTPEIAAEKVVEWTRASAIARAEFDNMVQQAENDVISGMQEQMDAIAERGRRLAGRVKNAMWSNFYLSLSLQLLTAVVIAAIFVAVCVKYPDRVQALSDRIVSWIR